MSEESYEERETRRDRERKAEERRELKIKLGIASAVLFFVVGVLALTMWGWPKYRIYKQELRGEATLREASWDRKVKVEEAKALLESAGHEAAAEIKRAEGVAEANKIIGDSLKDNEGYLRYLWIQNVGKDSDGERIYIATEAGLPILEARDERITK